ncbi:hypothetical protein LINGRAHAP2_LOCUS29338 [Linum grandiflorum]
MRLGRWNFNGRKIEADGWLPCAGRSSVAAERGVLWVRCDGIPIHLRSLALFKELGNVCGNFLDFKVDGCSMNAVRIKVGQAGVIPRQIPVTFKDESYSVRVTVEDTRIFADGWRGSGSDVFVRVGVQTDGSKNRVREKSYLLGNEAVQKMVSGLGDCDDRVDSDPSTEQIKGDGEKVHKRERVGVDSDSRADIEERKMALSLDDRDGVVDLVGEKGHKFSSGVRCSNDVAVEAVSLENGYRVEKGDLEDNGHVEEAFGPSPFRTIKEGVENVMEESFSEDVGNLDSGVGKAHMEANGVVALPLQLVDVGSSEIQLISDLVVENQVTNSSSKTPLSPALEEESFLPELGWNQSQPADAVSEEESSESEVEDSEVETDMDLDKGSEEEDEVLCKSLGIAAQLELKLGGSGADAEAVVRSVADEVLNKRNKVLSTSKKERELRRIRIDSSFSASVGNRVRQERGSGASSPSFYVS